MDAETRILLRICDWLVKLKNLQRDVDMYLLTEKLRHLTTSNEDGIVCDQNRAIQLQVNVLKCLKSEIVGNMYRQNK